MTDFEQEVINRLEQKYKDTNLNDKDCADIQVLLDTVKQQDIKLHHIKNRLEQEVNHCKNENGEYYDKCKIQLRFHENLLNELNEIDLIKYIHEKDIRNLITQLNEEYDKIQDKFDEVFFKKEPKDANDFIFQQSYVNTMQEVSWLIGRLQHLIEE